MSLLDGAVQPQLLTLLCSTSTPPISPIWQLHTAADPRSFITVLPDTHYPPAIDEEECERQRSRNTTLDAPPIPSRELHVPKHSQRGSLVDRVVHIQSAGVGDTYIEAGTSLAHYRASKSREIAQPLGIELAWLGVQMKPLGARDLSIEVGLVDAKGREGVVRLSNWKKEPTLHATRTPPLVHLPLQLPKDTSAVTDWVELSIHLSPLVALFRTLPSKHDLPNAVDMNEPGRKRQRPQPRVSGPDDPMAALPDGRLASVSYVRIYANCRLRRVWFAADGAKTVDSMGVRREWVLGIEAEEA